MSALPNVENFCVAAGHDEEGSENCMGCCYLRDYRRALMEALAEYFERFPGSFTSRMIAVDLRKMKEAS